MNTMRDFEQHRQQLIETCTSIAGHLKQSMPQSNHLQAIEHLIQDLQEDKQVMTVLGEFKRGKSTLLNALIGEKILVSDITPTTATVNVIQPSAGRRLTIEYHDGTAEEKELNPMQLQALTYEGEIDHDQVQRVKITLPIKNLDENILLIDTPGVGDLNDHQADVTYSYIPRSDLILFVIDATTPLRKTELQYLQDTVIPLRKGEMIFVLNFMDRIDEDEMDEVIEFVTKRLKKVLPDEPVEIYPLSAIEALEGDCDEFSYFLEGLHQKIEQGRLSENKAAFYQDRYQHVLKLIQEDIEKTEQLIQMNQAELQKGFEEIGLFIEEAEFRKAKLLQYGTERKRDMFSIIRKSLDYFQDNLVESVKDEIDSFYGGNFDKYIEKTLPISIKRQIESWLNNNTHNIEVMMKKFESEVVKGLNRAFNESSRNLGITLSPVSIHSIERVRFSGEGLSSNATLASGLIAGGAAAAFVAMGGFILLPILSLAGMPVLTKFLSEKKLDQAKERVIPEVESVIGEVIDKLKGALEDYMEKAIDSINSAALTVFEEEVRRYKLDLEQALHKRIAQQDQLLPPKEGYLQLKQYVQQQSVLLLEV
jgi:GTPase Era involved in 16S rRNA processing